MHLLARLLVALIALGNALVAHAEDFTDADWDAIRGVISRQLEAFKQDDAEAAFSFAAPSIREQFGTADAFMRMVREGYAALYRASSTLFLPPIRSQTGPMQPVEVTDQRDGTWRIAGCVLSASHGQSV
jgi:hypothetical protein